MQHAILDREEVSRKVREILSEQAFFVTLSDLIQQCILLICDRSTERRWNYLERRVELITNFLEGKSKLKKMIGEILSRNKLVDTSSEKICSQLDQAFEDGLRRLIDNGLLDEREENLFFKTHSYRLKKYKITQKGLESVRPDNLLIRCLNLLMDQKESSNT